MLLSIKRHIKISILVKGKNELENGLKDIGIDVGFSGLKFRFYDPNYPRDNPNEQLCRYFVEGVVEQEQLERIIKYLKEDYPYAASMLV